MGDKLLIRFENYRVTEVTDLRIGERWVLKSECNRCGLCCTIKRVIPEHLWDEEKKSCKHLVVEGKIGEPNASRCDLHNVSFFKPFKCVVDFRGELPEVEDVCTMKYERMKT